MGRRKKGDKINGWVALDKPADMTSTQAVSKVRRLFNAQKAGHAGTLDPLATGMLPIALGEATKTVPYVMDARKTYDFTIRWGISTDSQDAEGKVINTSNTRPTADQVSAILPQFIGDIMQVPPKYSAIKVDGERAYDLARDGEDFTLNARPVTLYDVQLLDTIDADHTRIRMVCGKGGYVRALARDICNELGMDGHVIDLRRTQLGAFAQDNAISLDLLETLCQEGTVCKALSPLSTALDDIPALAVSIGDATKLRQGRAIALLPRAAETLRETHMKRDPSGNDRTVLVTADDREVALCDACAGQLRPHRVFVID